MASASEERATFGRATGIDEAELLELVQQADLLRVNGIGVMFMLMLIDMGVSSTDALAAQDVARLHADLAAYNKAERVTRRSPTVDEIRLWVEQASALRLGSRPAPTPDPMRVSLG